ncbi:MAG: serine hydrolase domain-containing protein, partial [Cyclobacteriaceae bacterium]
MKRLVLLLLIFTTFCSEREGISSHDELDAYVTTFYKSSRLPGLAIAIVHQDLVYVRAFGYSDLHTQNPFTSESIFFTGTFSEIPMALMILELEKKGMVQMHDPVSAYLPYFQLKGDSSHPSVHHLVTHTSGIPDFSVTWEDSQYPIDELEMTVKSISDQPLLFEPGTARKRSSYNYDILADLIQKISGLSLEAASDRCFSSLNLHNSGFHLRKMDSNKLVRPHILIN